MWREQCLTVVLMLVGCSSWLPCIPASVVDGRNYLIEEFVRG